MHWNALPKWSMKCCKHRTGTVLPVCLWENGDEYNFIAVFSIYLLYIIYKKLSEKMKKKHCKR